MRSLRYLALTAAVALVFSAGAFAKDSNSGNFDLTQTVRIGSTMLQPGHYKAEWTGPSNALQVSIVEHGKTVATTQGKLKVLPSKSPYTSVAIQRENQKLNEIDFSGSRDALVIAGS